MSAPDQARQLVARIRRQNWDQGCSLAPYEDLWLADFRQPLTPTSETEADRLTPEAGALGKGIAHGMHSAGQMIIVTQRCDLVAPTDREPLCEAVPLVVWPKEKGLPPSNSARYFVVNRAKRLVAAQALRLEFEKTLLPDEDATQLISDPDRWRSFQAWCARRYSRFPWPDDFVEVFGKALESAITKSQERIGVEPIHSWRAIAEPVSDDSVEVTLLMIYDETHSGASETVAAGQAIVESMAKQLPKKLAEATKRAKGQPVRKHVLKAYQAFSSDQVTLRELIDFPPLNLEHLTYQGEEILGVEPGEELLH